MTTLSIGNYDKGAKPTNLTAFFNIYHRGFVGAFDEKRFEFRDDDKGIWKGLQEIATNEVKVLQTFLFDAGFMPKSNKDGVFGYATQAAVRLFQEYVRVEEGYKDCIPDGVVGPKTWSHIQRWQQSGKKADYGNNSEYQQWLTLLRATKEYYLKNPSPILELVNQFPKNADTRRIADWTFEEDDVHLIGVRVGEEKKETKRTNNDIFILLINGMVFKFWGSTDPNPTMSNRKDEPFLVEGQHKYGFAWHQIGNTEKIYRALWPYSKFQGKDGNVGVMVYRDWNDDNALTEEDLAHRQARKQNALDTNLNQTINIHWSGYGYSNWSAGCQVLAGKSYINNKNNVVDCSSYAANGNTELGQPNKTKGAYNVFTDLVLSYAPPMKDYLLYTLGRDEILQLSQNFGADYVINQFNRMAGNG